MKKNMDTTAARWGYIRIMAKKKKMETAIF